MRLTSACSRWIVMKTTTQIIVQSRPSQRHIGLWRQRLQDLKIRTTLRSAWDHPQISSHCHWMVKSQTKLRWRTCCWSISRRGTARANLAKVDSRFTKPTWTSSCQGMPLSKVNRAFKLIVSASPWTHSLLTAYLNNLPYTLMSLHFQK